MFLEQDPGLGIWENEGGRIKAAVHPRLPPGRSHRGAHGGVPRFVNDVGARTVAIGVTALNCIGATPPADHPHVYLEMGKGADILCPYCATRFCFRPALRFDETLPPGCFHDSGAGASAFAPRLPAKGNDMNPASSIPTGRSAGALKEYGIGGAAAALFEAGAFRHSRLEDAIAEARRRGREAGDGS